jgi:hydroxymethylglutaryl-CoA lyase
MGNGMTDRVEIVDVAPRDGLQSQPQVLDTATKLEFIRRLVDAGIRRIEVASFVDPRRVPQMADAEAVVEGLPRGMGARFIGLVLNARGLERALATGIDEINCVVSASDQFGLRNQGADTAASMRAAVEIGAGARGAGREASVTISAAFGCPFEGEVPPARVVDLAARLADAGFREVAVADTIGAAGPSNVSAMIPQLRAAIGDAQLRMHFHDTRNTGVANAYAAIMAGVRVFDSSCGGIGGCPFAPAATGNVATEDLLYMIGRMGLPTGIDIEKVIETARWMVESLQIRAPALLSRAGMFPPRAAAGRRGAQ